MLCEHDKPDPTRNKIILATEPLERLRLFAASELVYLRLRALSQRVGEPIGHVYFVESGVVSMIATMADGGSAEVGLVGHDGVIGLPLTFGIDIANLDALVQVDGRARRVPAAAFYQMLDSMPSLRRSLLRYAHVFHCQVAQIAACNAKHRVDKRLARWILMTADRIDNDEFATTHEFIARMLGVQRPGLTQALQRLHASGLITSKLGRLRIVDRSALELASCECYQINHDLFQGRLPTYTR